MKEDKDIELDCSKNCTSVVPACEAEGRDSMPSVQAMAVIARGLTVSGPSVPA